MKEFTNLNYLSNDITNSENTSNSLDLYLADNIEKDKKPSLLVFIHGGAWVDRDKSDYKWLSDVFCSQDLAVAVINYRLTEKHSDSKVMHPDHTQDCVNAINWLKSNCEEYGFNKHSIFVLGHSAGGFMIAEILLNLQNWVDDEHKSSSDENNFVSGVIASESIFDLISFQNFDSTYNEMFLDFVFGKDNDSYREKISPINLGKESKTISKAPWLIIHSKNDELVSYSESSRFSEHLNSLNISHELDLNVSSQTHFESLHQLKNYKNSKEAQEQRDIILNFVNQNSK